VGRDADVRDQGLLPREHPAVSASRRLRLQRGDVAAGLGLGEREGAYRRATGDLGADALAELGPTRREHGEGAEALHGEDRVRHRAALRERLAHEDERPHVDMPARALAGAREQVTKQVEALRAEGRDGAVRALGEGAGAGRDGGAELGGERDVPLLEERPRDVEREAER
jgi:hypothetical protein